MPEPTLATLALVQIHCLTTFAFESLALHYEALPPSGRAGAMNLDPEYVFRRYVSAEEGGGYCFQSNYLLLQMLRALGYQVFPVLGRVFKPQLEGERPFLECFGGLTHMVLLVRLRNHTQKQHRMGYYLADIGFGRGIHRPMLLAHGHREAGCEGVEFKLTKVDGHGRGSNFVNANSCDDADPSEHDLDDEEGRIIANASFQLCWQLSRSEEGVEGGKPQTCYIFNTTECFPADFAVSNLASATSLDPAISPFATSMLVCKYFFSPDKPHKKEYASDLYPYQPSQILQKSLANTAYKNPAGEKTELTTEQDRVELLKREFGLLLHIPTDQAVRNIQDKPSAINISTTP